MEPAGRSFSADADDRRCICGSLLARLCKSGVELKCRRCKRVVVIPWSASASWHRVTIEWEKPAPGPEG